MGRCELGGVIRKVGVGGGMEGGGVGIAGSVQIGAD